MRNLYRDPETSQVWEYDDDQVEAGFVREGLVKMNQEEIDAHLSPAPPTAEQLIERFRSVIQEHMDAAARLVGYDDIKTAVTYAEEPAIPKFQAEGKALRAWRSLVWAYGHEQIDAVQSGARTLPTPEELIAELPPLVMP